MGSRVGIFSALFLGFWLMNTTTVHGVELTMVNVANLITVPFISNVEEKAELRSAPSFGKFLAIFDPAPHQNFSAVSSNTSNGGYWNFTARDACLSGRSDNTNILKWLTSVGKIKIVRNIAVKFLPICGSDYSLRWCLAAIGNIKTDEPSLGFSLSNNLVERDIGSQLFLSGIFSDRYSRLSGMRRENHLYESPQQEQDGDNSSPRAQESGAGHFLLRNKVFFFPLYLLIGIGITIWGFRHASVLPRPLTYLVCVTGALVGWSAVVLVTLQ